MFLHVGEKRFRFLKLCYTKDHPDLGAKVRHKSITIKILELNNIAQINRNFIYNMHFAFKKINQADFPYKSYLWQLRHSAPHQNTLTQSRSCRQQTTSINKPEVETSKVSSHTTMKIPKGA